MPPLSGSTTTTFADISPVLHDVLTDVFGDSKWSACLNALSHDTSRTCCTLVTTLGMNASEASYASLAHWISKRADSLERVDVTVNAKRWAHAWVEHGGVLRDDVRAVVRHHKARLCFDDVAIFPDASISPDMTPAVITDAWIIRASSRESHITLEVFGAPNPSLWPPLVFYDVQNVTLMGVVSHMEATMPFLRTVFPNANIQTSRASICV